MGIGVTEIIILGGLLALLFGSRKLPALGADLGRGLRDLRGHFSAKPPAPAEDAPFEEPAAGAKGGGR